MAVQCCGSCEHKFGQQDRFCPNCGAARPLPRRTEANPAPTFTPESILASLEEEKGDQEHAAEAPPEGSPKLVTEPNTPPQNRAPDGGGLVQLSKLSVAAIIGLLVVGVLGVGGFIWASSLAFVVTAVLAGAALLKASGGQLDEEAVRHTASVHTAPLPPSPLSNAGARAQPDRTGSGTGNVLLKLLAALFTGAVFAALLLGVLAMGGVGIEARMGIALLVFVVVAAYTFSTIKTAEERGTSISGTAPVRSRSIPQWVKIAVATRDGGTCRRCGSGYDLQYDHVIPYSRGGSSTEVNNIQLLCGKCNRRKSNRYIG